eukprot:Gb_38457 [translate_table: standard]
MQSSSLFTVPPVRGSCLSAKAPARARAPTGPFLAGTSLPARGIPPTWDSLLQRGALPIPPSRPEQASPSARPPTLPGLSPGTIPFLPALPPPMRPPPLPDILDPDTIFHYRIQTINFAIQDIEGANQNSSQQRPSWNSSNVFGSFIFKDCIQLCYDVKRKKMKIEKTVLFLLEQQGYLASRIEALGEEREELMEQSDFSRVHELREAYRAVGQDLLKLLYFVEINAIGLRKILKKFDKRFGYRLTDYYVTTRSNHPYSQLQQVFKHVGIGAVVGALSRNLAELQDRRGSYSSIYDQPIAALALQDPVIDAIKDAVERLTHSTNFLRFLGQHALIMEEELPRPSEEYIEDQRYHFVSLVLNLVNTFLYMVNTYIIVPTADKYSMSLGAAATLCGVIIGSMAVAQLVSSVYFSAWSNRSYFRPLVFSSVVLFLGNLLYAIAYDLDSLSVLLIGRILCGNVFGSFIFKDCIQLCYDVKRKKMKIEKTVLFLLEQQGYLASRIEALGEEREELMEQSDFSRVHELREAYRAVGQDLLKLLYFVEINAIGLRKILKKFDKRFGYRLTDYYVTTRSNHPYSQLQQVFKHVGIGAVVGALSRNLAELQDRRGSYSSIYDQPIAALALQDPVIDAIKDAVERLTHSTNFLRFLGQHALIMEEELPRPSEEYIEDQRYHFVSLVLNLVNTFLYMVNTYIIVPTADKYSMSLGAAATLCGVIIGSMAVAQLVSSVYFSAWSNRSYFRPLVFSSVVLFLGNLLYAIAYDLDSLSVLLIGRILCG